MEHLFASFKRNSIKSVFSTVDILFKSIVDMKKRTAFIGAILSLIPLGQLLFIKTGFVVSTAGIIFSVPEKLHAETATFYINLGIDKAELGDHYGAISNFTKAIEINPKSFLAYYNRANSKDELKDSYGAIADYTKAIEINPNYYQAYTNRGMAKDDIKDYWGAIADYTKAIEINSSSVISYINRGVTKFKIGDKKGACLDARAGKSLGASNGSKAVELLCQ
mgnify:CR=1 FL=1